MPTKEKLRAVAVIGAAPCHTPFGTAGFHGVCKFLKEAPRYIPEVTASAVTVPGLDIEAVRRLAEELGVTFRAREYAEVG